MEAAQRASKIHRFGAEDIQGGSDSGYENNVQRLSVEFGQLLAMADMLAGLGLIDLTRAEREKPHKIAKVTKFLQHDNAAGMKPRKPTDCACEPGQCAKVIATLNDMPGLTGPCREGYK